MLVKQQILYTLYPEIHSRGNLNMVDISKLVEGVVLGIVGIVVVFLLVGNLAPTITDASDNISGSGLPHFNNALSGV